MDVLLKSKKDEAALTRLSSGVGPGAISWRNLFASVGLIAVLMDRVRHPEFRHLATTQAAALSDWAKTAIANPSEVLLRRPASLEEAEYALFTLRYPYFSLKANRMAASPGLRRMLDRQDDDRLGELLQNNETLIRAFDEIENACQLCGEARDSVAIGWHAVAYSLLSRFPDEAQDLNSRAPKFLTEDARSRPFLSLAQPIPTASPVHRP